MNERDHLLAERQVMQTEHERVLGERDELVHSLSELQQQRQSVVGQSHELNLKYKSTQTEVGSHTHTHVQMSRIVPGCPELSHVMLPNLILTIP